MENDDELITDVKETADVFLTCLGCRLAADCPSNFSCRICKDRHHTSLQFDRPVDQQVGVTSGTTFSGSSVLLSTAMVGIDDTAGRTLMFRVLLESGSQTPFITADAASNLNPAHSTVDVKISGIGGRQKTPVTAPVLNSIATEKSS